MAENKKALTNQLPGNQEAREIRVEDDLKQDGSDKLTRNSRQARKSHGGKTDTAHKPTRAGKSSKDSKPLTAAQIIRKRRIGVEVRKGYISLAFRALAIVVIGWLLLTQFLLITQMPDESMFPTLEAGDLVIAYRLQSSYSKSDVVVYEVDGELKIGRVVARAGDVVTMSDSGTLLVNGTAQTGEILFSTYARDGITYPFTVPENCVFILCDYRTNGTDSRDYGAISLKNVEGKVITILRRRSI